MKIIMCLMTLSIFFASQAYAQAAAPTEAPADVEPGAPAATPHVKKAKKLAPPGQEKAEELKQVEGNSEKAQEAMKNYNHNNAKKAMQGQQGRPHQKGQKK